MTINNIPNIVKNIKLLISDVDGVLTDGKILINSNHTEGKLFNVEDGTGVALARYADLPIALISGRYSDSTTIRAKELGIEHCFQNTLNKLSMLDKILEIYPFKYHEVAYIGDGLVDLPLLKVVGLPISVPNAHKLSKKNAIYITEKSGGEGVLLEVVETILKSQNKYENVLELMRKDKFE